ncbi:MAG: peptidase MA family metallohydrolase [Elusimicrobia bacterium]|nr:peptidase MA family metallohydrolase [Elusimicrobiota bacterium]
MRSAVLALLAAGLCACMDLPESAAPAVGGASAIMRLPFQPLDPGAYEQVSLHFKVSAYGADNAHQISSQAEGFYTNIMTDTNLFSFMPSGLYEIVVYASHEEYVRKTGQPDWSGGVTYGNAICSYNGPQLLQTIAHEMTHLIFNEYMGRPRRDLLWLNEGLAVYEQAKAASGTRVPAELFGRIRQQVRSQPLALEDILGFVPLGERTDADQKVSLWYAQSESLVQFMIERGGRIGFSQFLPALKDGKGFDEAIRSAYIGVWSDLPGFYRAWQASP